ncbi:ADP-ribosylarginine hydrolase [Pelomyxa schiedti]|nr:ADP-ribosylarginine hydrolase [Pelomyxa schiedti]
MSRKYIACMEDMDKRAPGERTVAALILFMDTGSPWDSQPFDPTSGGCGGSMRAMCIGLRFHGPKRRTELIRTAIDSARITHNHPVAILGAVASALFTALAIEKGTIGILTWGAELLHTAMPIALDCIGAWRIPPSGGVKWDEAWIYFQNAWESYLKMRRLPAALDGTSSMPLFPEPYGIPQRDEFYKAVSFSGWGGSSGHDSVIIAYDALLWCVYALEHHRPGVSTPERAWEELLLRGALHGGDSDTTGAIAGAWWGALYGFRGVPAQLYENMEYKNRLYYAGDLLFATSS